MRCEYNNCYGQPDKLNGSQQLMGFTCIMLMILTVKRFI